MRLDKNKKATYNNEASLKELDKQLSKIFDRPPYNIQHLIYTIYTANIHKISCQALDSDKKLTKVDIEIPYYGKLSLDTSDTNNIKVTEFYPEEEFKEDIKNAVVSGSSRLYELARKKVTERIKERFNNALG